MRAKPNAMWLCIPGVAGIACIDHLAGPWIRLDPLYYAPVAFAAWRGGHAAGVMISLLSAFARVSTSLAGGAGLPGHVLAVNAGLQLVGCLAIAVLTVRVTGLLTAERETARRDPLTGLHNARALIERFALERARAQRGASPVTIASLDLDRFKEVNDSWGHSTGDRVLHAVADVLVRNLRAADTVARVGGDEFVAVLWDTPPDVARQVLSRLRAEIKASMTASGWPVTTSIGAASYVACVGSMDEMRARADRALYRAKHRGRDALELDVA